MSKTKMMLIYALIWLIGLLDGDCTLAVIITVFLLSAVFQRKGKHNVRL